MEASADVSAPYWPSITALTITNGNASYTDHESVKYKRRFYRARAVDPVDGMLIQGTVRSAVDMSPIAGAIVGTSLDVQFALTDGDGNFFLAPLFTGDFQNLEYNIIAAAPRYNSSIEAGVWGQRPTGISILLERFISPASNLE